MNRHAVLTLLSVTLLFAAFGLPVEAATIVVPNGGSIQVGLDAAAPGDTVIVKAGLYVGDLSMTTADVALKGYGCGNSIIEGVATVPAASAPLAVPNIDIQADGARVTGFTIRSPAVAEDFYSSGMVVVGTNVEIDRNCFEAGTGAGSQAIQTWAFSNASSGLNDISGLRIHENKFTHRAPATVASDPNAYEGVYINPQDGVIDAANPVVIELNKFSGDMFRAVTVDARSFVVVAKNTMSTSGVATAGFPTFPRGIQLTDNYAGLTTDLTVSRNTLLGPGLATKFYWGIVLRNPVPAFTAVSFSTVVGNSLKNVASDKAIAVQGEFGFNSVVDNEVWDNPGDGIYVDGDTFLDRNHALRNGGVGIRAGIFNTLAGNVMKNNGVLNFKDDGGGTNVLAGNFCPLATSGLPITDPCN